MGAQGYTMNALVGKDGAEAAFESYLHGTPGQRMVVTDEAGRVTSTSYAQEPRQGGTSPSPWTGTCRPRRRRPWGPSWTATPSPPAGPWWPWT